MKNLLKKIETKIKKSSSKDPEQERISQMLEQELKKSQSKEHRGAIRTAPPKPEEDASPSEEGVETFDKIPDNEGGTYHVYEVVKIQLPPRSTFDIKYEYQDPTGKNSTIAN